MLDVHYHMLFDVDDGPETLEDSLQLAEASIAEGVTHVVCTPHANDVHRFDPAVNQERLNAIKERLGDRLTLGLGCDFHLTFDNIQDALQHRSKYSINGHQYLLVEFPEFGVSQRFSDVLFQLSAAGYVPIITHPERNPELQLRPQLLLEWLRGGCIIQVTAASLLGRFGRRAQSMSLSLLKKNWVALIASDAHSIKGRPPSMAPAHVFLKTEFGGEVADRLCVDVPKAIFFGEELPPMPEPEGEFSGPRGKRGLFRRIFSRA